MFRSIRGWFCVALALVAAVAAAQLDQAAPKPIRGLRNLALSPDGASLAFVYKGDVWVVSSQGGRATRLTGNVEMDSNPVWSPDGRWIAFASNRDGRTDTYLVPVEGGAPRRLTWSGAVPSAWTPDGKEILVSQNREDTFPGLYAIDVKTTALRRLYRDFVGIGSPTVSPDGKLVAFNRRGFPWYRPRYQGSAAASLWLLDTATGKARALRENGFQHLWLRFGSDGKTVYTVTVSEVTPSSSPLSRSIGKIVDSTERTPNVYAVDLNGRAKRLTSFAGGGVRSLTAAANAPLLAFEYEGDPYTMAPGGQPAKIAIFANEDELTPTTERLVLTDGASNLAVSPDGERIAFVARNDIWVVPITKGKGPNKDDATQLTDWPGLDDEPVWHPDGKSLFFVSDREGPQRIYRVNVETKETSVFYKTDSDAHELRLTPDRKHLAFWVSGADGGIYWIPVGGGEAKKLVDYPGQHNWNNAFSFSPDGRYLVYARQKGNVPFNLYVVDLSTGKEQNVTRLAATHGNPVWSADGKYLYFTSNRDGDGLYLLPLTAEDARTPDLEMRYAKPKEGPKVQIDFDDIHLRIRKLTGQPVAGEPIVDRETGDVYFVSNDGDLWRCSYNGESVSKVTQGGRVGMCAFFESGDRIVFEQAGTLKIYTPRQLPPRKEGDKEKPGVPAGIQDVPFRAVWVRDIRGEQRAAFYQFWRMYNRNFYDPNFHGRDWVRIRDRYAPLLESVGHRSELAIVLNMMVGELESSHSEVGPPGGGPTAVPLAHLGFDIDYGYKGPGLRVAAVPKGAPGSFAKTLIKPGEYVLQVNGKDVSNNELLYRDVLAGEVGRDLKLLVNGSPNRSGAREVTYRALTSGEYGGILYRNRIEARKKWVDQASGGKVAYVHISGMGGGNFTQFNREVWSESLGKKAVIIDVRDNGGGNISDQLIDILERVPHSYYRDRDGETRPAPDQSWDLPTVVLHAESSFSNAEMFPYAMKARRLATLVGMPTPGYVIWTWGLPLVDGTSARMPAAGVWRLDGTPLENNGQKPDIEVQITTEEYFRGEDPQLAKAVEVLLGKVR